jgi:sugar lactone lactonase YvrE
MGPLSPGGVAGIRPFTIDAQDPFAFTTANRFLGFQVSDVATGRVLFTAPVPGFTVPAMFSGLPSHGIGLSPDQRSLWLVDKPNRAVHEFDITGLPRRAPALIATVRVSGPSLGWLNLSRDGRYLFAGGAGDVIDTATRTTVARVPWLVSSRYNIEIDWSRGRVCAAYPRESLGYVGVTPACQGAAG